MHRMQANISDNKQEQDMNKASPSKRDVRTVANISPRLDLKKELLRSRSPDKILE